MFFLLGTAQESCEGIGADVVTNSQEILIQSMEEKEHGMFLMGGTEAALLWAVYELGEHWGMVYLHDQDVFLTAKPFRPTEISLRLTPAIRKRTYM